VSFKSKILFLAVILCCVGLLIYLRFLPPPSFQVVFLNVGQGDASLIFLESGAKILIDCGPDQKILRKLGERFDFFDRQIDYLLVTHPDKDHYGGCLDVLKRYEVKNIFVNTLEKENEPLFLSWKGLLLSEGAEIFTIKNNAKYVLDGAELEFFNPDPALPVKGDNDASLVFKFTYNTTTVFFAADMENNLENQLLLKYCPTSTKVCSAFESDYLKVGHHGSDSSSGENFLKAVDAEKAIISVGKNSYGHPSQRVLKRLQRAGMEVLRTDQKGDIIVE